MWAVKQISFTAHHAIEFDDTSLILQICTNSILCLCMKEHNSLTELLSENLFLYIQDPLINEHLRTYFCSHVQCVCPYACNHTYVYLSTYIYVCTQKKIQNTSTTIIYFDVDEHLLLRTPTMCMRSHTRMHIYTYAHVQLSF